MTGCFPLRSYLTYFCYPLSLSNTLKNVNSNAVLAATNYGDSRFNPITNGDLPNYSFLAASTLMRLGVDFMSGVVSPPGLMSNPGGRDEFEVSKGGSAFTVKFKQYDSSGTKYAGSCLGSGELYNFVGKRLSSLEECFEYCESLEIRHQVGLHWLDRDGGVCFCDYDNDKLPSELNGGFLPSYPTPGSGPVQKGSGSSDTECYPRKVRSTDICLRFFEGYFSR